ncbi:MAG: glycosyltransferase family 4 protein [Erysipelotrichaceae bacterium]|nr:glycosyltransferase family 4 protein [Erysipelotrichaceae bacterium]
MRIMHCLFGFNIGGIEVMVKNLSISATKHQIKSHIVALSIDDRKMIEDKFAEIFNHSDITFTCLNKPFKKHRLKTIFDLRDEINKFKPTIILIHLEMLTPYLLLACLGLKVKCVQVVHNEVTEGDFFHRWFGRYFVKHYVFVSNRAYHHGINAFKCENKATVIHNGIDLSFHNNHFNTELSFLFVGRLTTQKDPLALIAIYEDFKNKISDDKVVTLHIVGDGELKQACEEAIKCRNLSDKIFIFGNKSDIDQYYHQHSILLLPSLWEGLPLVIMEAMAYGMACISYDVGGVSEIIDNKVNGILIPPQERSAFVDAMLKLVNDDQYRWQIQKQAREKATTFAITNTFDKYLALFQKLKGD